MLSVKFPKKLKIACENNDIDKIRHFILQDGLGRYSFWATPMIEQFGFNLFKQSMLDWNHVFFNKYKPDLINVVMRKACENNSYAQEYIVDHNIPFTEDNIFNLNYALKLTDNNFIKKLSKINTDLLIFFNPESVYFNSLNSSFYKKHDMLKLLEFFNLKFEQKHLDSFLYSSALFANAESCKYWLNKGADIELKSIEQYHKNNGDFWAFDCRNIIFFNNKKTIVGQEETFKTLVDNCTKEQLSLNNPLWANTAKKIINHLDNNSAKVYIRESLRYDADFSFSWFKNENEAAKFIDEFYIYGASKILKKWTEEDSDYKSKLIQLVFKHAVLNGQHEMCKDLIDNGFNAKKFIESQAFKNITKDGSLLIKKQVFLKPHIELSRKIVNSYSLKDELMHNLGDNAPIKGKKNKI